MGSVTHLLHRHPEFNSPRSKFSGTTRPRIRTRGFITYPSVYEGIAENGKLGFSVSSEDYSYFHLLQDYPIMKPIKNPREAHTHIVKRGIDPGLSLSNHFLIWYIKSGGLDDARQLFDKMFKRDMSSWGHMIAGYAQNRRSFEALELFLLLQRHKSELGVFIITSAVQACGGLDECEMGMQMHAYVIKCRFDCGVGIGTALLTMYLNFGRIDDARKVFDRMTKPNIVSWTAMISGYAKNQRSEEAIQLFSAMRSSLMKPNHFTFASVLSALTALGVLEKGKGVHACAIKTGFEIDVSVGSALLSMYVNCGSMEDAFKMFEGMPTRNVVSWSAMIGGYAQAGCGEEALKLFRSMLRMRVRPNEFTFSGVLSACTTQVALYQGKEVHTQTLKNGFDSNVIVGSALITMYSSCGLTKNAESVFERITELNIVAWTAMLTGYSQNCRYEEALKHFVNMRQEGLKPNQVAFASVLSACASLASLGQGKQLHGCIVKTEFMSDVSVGNALVSMYDKCGSIEDAHAVFNQMPDRDLISWSAIIAGYAQHGNGRKSLQLFEQMQKTGIRPDLVIFVSVLAACSNAGLVDEGRFYFGSMIREHCISPCLEHYTSMVDLLARAGLLDEAGEVINKMPLKPDVKVWRTLLSSSIMHGDMKLAQHAAECILKLEPNTASTYVLLSNIYAATERWDLVEKIRKIMKDMGAEEKPGCSWIEIQNNVHTFASSNRSHPQAEKIYAKMDELSWKIQEEGYAPNTELLLNDVQEQQKAQVVCYHSENLAIAFGLISTSSETPIRVFKDLRICADCHTSTKLISKIVGREIIVRDTNQFHHFQNGLCSCGDYW